MSTYTLGAAEQNAVAEKSISNFVYAANSLVTPKNMQTIFEVAKKEFFIHVRGIYG